MKITKNLLTAFLMLLPFSLWAQGASSFTDTLASNKHTVNTIQNYDVMWKKSLWFMMDLRFKVNEGFYAKNNELTRVLIDAVKNDMILPYKNDSLETRMSKDEFLSKLRIPQTELEGDSPVDDWAAEEWGVEAKTPQRNADNEYDPRDFFLVEVKVDRVFDRRRSTMYNDIVSLTFFLPAEYNKAKLDKPIASFSYKELYNQVFHIEKDGQVVDNPEAVWYNSQNSSQHRNLADAFALGMYEKRLVKYENPKDNTIVDLYGDGKKGYYQSMEVLYKLMEYEATLWSY
ncbi:gliding motility protein GldN [Limibacter armeniacum]|uniref:type IX secretion system ring protein PorN/GldN n=1 Tax=Limibacter armeniacum TaxID=466084 RepID=UPI002FE56F26